MKKLVILGAGTAGTMVANRLRRLLDSDEWQITIVDQNETHYYQPGFLFIPFGMYSKNDVIKPKRDFIPAGVEFITSPIEIIEPEHNRVRLVKDHRYLPYDFLVIATGTQTHPEQTPGLQEHEWYKTIFDFYTIEGAVALARHLRTFEGGRVVLNVVENPIKCPVAPLEFCFLADWYFTERGIRDKVEITYATPLDGAFTKPISSARLGDLLAEKGVHLVTEFNAGEADGEAGKLVGYDGREVPFDLLAVIPLHSGQEYVGRSPGLGDDLDFVPTNPATLQSTTRENVFAIGDATNLPVSKAGSVTHFEGEVLVDNIVRFLDGRELDAGYDGHANCFIETGFSKALLIDFNYETEPLPGHFPAQVGLPLLKESRLNHMGKLMFQWLYWHVLLPGRDIPGIGATMPQRGKTHPTATPQEAPK